MCVMDSQWVRPQQRAWEHCLSSAVHGCVTGPCFAVPAAAAAPCRSWKAAQVMERGFGAASPGSPRLEWLCEHLMLLSSQVPGSAKGLRACTHRALWCIFWQKHGLSSAAWAGEGVLCRSKQAPHREPCRITCGVRAAVPDGFISLKQAIPGWKSLPAVFGAGCSMACLERRQCNSNTPILLFPKEPLNHGYTTV